MMMPSPWLRWAVSAGPLVGAPIRIPKMLPAATVRVCVSLFESTYVNVQPVASQLAPSSRGPPMLWHRHAGCPSPPHTDGGGQPSPHGSGGQPSPHCAEAAGTTRAKPTTTNSRVSVAATTVRYIDPPLGSVSGRGHRPGAPPETCESRGHSTLVPRLAAYLPRRERLSIRERFAAGF